MMTCQRGRMDYCDGPSSSSDVIVVVVDGEGDDEVNR